MRKNLLFFVAGGLFILLGSASAQAQCPEDPNDNGICDTMQLEIYPPDVFTTQFVRVPIYVTHDVSDPAIDSIQGFMIPLCFEATNPSADCDLSPSWNNTSLYPSPEVDWSIFRHLDAVTNWMMSLAEQSQGLEWDLRVLDVYTQPDQEGHFWFYMNPVGDEDRLFGEESRVLVLTLTFEVKDSTTICIDSCFWPPSDHLSFWRGDWESYIPRHNLPYCVSISHRALGDCNADGAVDASDAVYLINYLFRDGPTPPLQLGDVNCDGAIQAGDVVFLLNYLFRRGPEPSC